MIDLQSYSNGNDNLRKKLDIPLSSIVFGRYGGFNQFDISYVHDAIIDHVNKNLNTYFLFANTNVFYKHPQIIYLNTIYDNEEKVKFINTCDAMIHARSDGETFGLSIAEFSIKNKPIITTFSSLPNSDAHINMLGDCAIIYKNKNDLLHIFENIKNIIDSKNDWNAFKDYTPENVMKKFMEIFIN